MTSQLLAQMGECFVCGETHNRRKQRRRSTKDKCPWLRIAPSLVELLDLLARLEVAEAMAFRCYVIFRYCIILYSIILYYFVL